MENRVAVLAIIVRDTDAVLTLNELLHRYGEHIIGRMGLPCRDRGLRLISVALDAPGDVISALSGKNVHRIWEAIDKAYASYSRQIQTSKLNVWLQEIKEFGHTVSQGKKMLKIKYVTQTATCPPQFTFFVNHPDLCDDNYQRYLENRLRKTFDLEGTPIRLKFKKKD